MTTDNKPRLPEAGDVYRLDASLRWVVRDFHLNWWHLVNDQSQIVYSAPSQAHLAEWLAGKNPLKVPLEYAGAVNLSNRLRGVWPEGLRTFADHFEVLWKDELGTVRADHQLHLLAESALPSLVSSSAQPATEAGTSLLALVEALAVGMSRERTQRGKEPESPSTGAGRAYAAALDAEVAEMGQDADGDMVANLCGAARTTMMNCLAKLKTLFR